MKASLIYVGIKEYKEHNMDCTKRIRVYPLAEIHATKIWLTERHIQFWGDILSGSISFNFHFYTEAVTVDLSGGYAPNRIEQVH